MSLKNIELQHILPKTQDIGKIQQQLHQRPDIEQGILTSEMKQKEIEKRKKTEKLSKSDLEGKNTTRKPKNERVKDPNKGRFVDLEL